MRRVFLGSTTVLALALGGLIAAQSQNTSPQPPPPGPAQKGGPKDIKPIYKIDVDRLLKEYDKNGDGFLQRDEVPGYIRDHFDQIDTNKDGKLSREELERGAGLLQPKRQPSDMVHILIEMSDCDECAADELQKIYDVLRKLDKNNTGKIDPAALKAVRHEMVEHRVDHIIKELDVNKDGKISRDEARGALKRNFDLIDTNKDGYIDRAELLRAATERTVTKQDKEK
jgi:Ca2+-binding EF-hand superfamily protein